VANKKKSYSWRNKNQFPSLVDHNKVILSPLHIILRPMKNFVEAMDKNGNGFLFLKLKFPKLSDAKIKEEI
jgi:hypothetical protein